MFTKVNKFFLDQFCFSSNLLLWILFFSIFCSKLNLFIELTFDKISYWVWYTANILVSSNIFGIIFRFNLFHHFIFTFDILPGNFEWAPNNERKKILVFMVNKVNYFLLSSFFVDFSWTVSTWVFTQLFISLFLCEMWKAWIGKWC